MQSLLGPDRIDWRATAGAQETGDFLQITGLERVTPALIAGLARPTRMASVRYSALRETRENPPPTLHQTPDARDCPR